MFDLNLFANLGCTGVPTANVPVRRKQAVNNTGTGGRLIELEQIGRCRTR
jgi:hypothetical protein